MGDKTPPVDSQYPWYENTRSGRVLEYFNPKEWEEIYKTAEKEEKGAQVTHFQEYEGLFWAKVGDLSDKVTTRKVKESLHHQINRSFYQARVYYTLIEESEEQQRDFANMKRERDKIRFNKDSNLIANHSMESATNRSSIQLQPTAPPLEDPEATTNVQHQPPQTSPPLKDTGAISKHGKETPIMVPPRTGTIPYYTTPRFLKTIERDGYSEDQWKKIVSAVELETTEERKRKFWDLYHRFEIIYRGWQANMENNEIIPKDSFEEGKRVYLTLYLYHSLDENREINEEEYNYVLEKKRKGEDHNIRIEDYEKQQLFELPLRRNEDDDNNSELSDKDRIPYGELGLHDKSTLNQEELQEFAGLTNTLMRDHENMTESQVHRMRHFSNKSRPIRDQESDTETDSEMLRHQQDQEFNLLQQDMRELKADQKVAMARQDNKFQELMKLLQQPNRQNQRSLENTKDNDDKSEETYRLPRTNNLTRWGNRDLKNQEDFDRSRTPSPRYTPNTEIPHRPPRGPAWQRKTEQRVPEFAEQGQRRMTVTTEGMDRYENDIQHSTPALPKLKRPLPQLSSPISGFARPSQPSRNDQGLLQNTDFRDLRLRSTQPDQLEDLFGPEMNVENPTGYQRPPFLSGRRNSQIDMDRNEYCTPVPRGTGIPRRAFDATFTRPRETFKPNARTFESRTTDNRNDLTERDAGQQNINISMLNAISKIADRLEPANGQGRSTARVRYPDIRIDKFGGDETKFLQWYTEFVEYISMDPNMSNHQKCILLKMHLSEEVKEQLCFTSSETLPYEDCMRLLLRKYARPERTCREYRRKIAEIKGPRADDDYKGLDRMCMSVKKYVNALGSLGQSVDQIGILVQDAVVDKLPRGMYGEFISFCYHDTIRRPQELHITDLLHELEKFADMLLDVQRHRIPNRTAMEHGERSRENNGQERTYHQTTMVTTGDRANVNTPNEIANRSCALCLRNDHWTEKCKEYRTWKTRKDRFYELRLCYRCAKPHNGGVAACTHRWNCGAVLPNGRCTKGHHISLHIYQENREAPGPPQDGNNITNQNRPSSRDRTQRQNENETQPQNNSGTNNRNEGGRIRFVDERERNEQNASGNGPRRE